MGVEDDCVCSSPKLFIGQIPSDVTRDSLLSLFESFGRVHRIDMLTPRQLNVTTRSAMVWFETWTDVESILDSHEEDPFDLGGPKTLVIRIADPPKRGENCIGIKPRKLFIGQIPREVEDNEVQQLFSRFGVIEEFEVPKRLSAVSCAFVRFRKWNQAECAIQSLNENYIFPQSKRALVVKFADAKIADPAKTNAQLIGEKRPLTPEDRCDFVKRQYFHEGERKRVDPIDMGYLTSRMGMPMGVGTFTGMGRIEWIREESQRFLKEVDGGRSGLTVISGAVGTTTAFSSLGMALAESSERLTTLPSRPDASLPTDHRGVVTGSTIRTLGCLPPVGPNGKLGKGFSDPKVKDWTLFVGQIPHQADEYTLWDVFCAFGEILELNVLRKDGKHRGCAFVTYETKEMSLAAIEKLDGTSFPWDINHRKLVVRFREKCSKNN